jgi:hypothetical protein
MRYFTSILILVMIVGLGFVGLSNYINVVHGQTSSLITTDTANGSGTTNGAVVLALLNRLNGIELNGKIFTSTAFKSLQDFSIPLTPQAVGRSNPYLPTYGTIVAAPKTATTTKAKTSKLLLK